jgi:transposase
LWGDACGYVWGRQEWRIEIAIDNVRDRQTYYGALEVSTGQFHLRPYPQANSHATVLFPRYLQRCYPDQQLLLFWDRASYHRQGEMATFLQQVNQDLPPAQWRIICLPLAPYAPEENPVEDIWLKGKTFVRKQAWLTTTFVEVKQLFVQGIRQERYFDFPKLNQYLSSHN